MVVCKGRNTGKCFIKKFGHYVWGTTRSMFKCIQVLRQKYPIYKIKIPMPVPEEELLNKSNPTMVQLKED